VDTRSRPAKIPEYGPAVVSTASEIFGLCQLEKLFRLGCERYFAGRSSGTGEPDEQIRRIFLGSLVSIAAGPSTLGVLAPSKRELHSSFEKLVGQLQEKANPGDRSYLQACLDHRKLGFTFTGQSFQPPPSNAHLRHHPNVPKLLPGDCLFRELNPPLGNFSKAIRDLGHTGIYVGLFSPDADPTDSNNHLVVEMTPQHGCHVTTVDQFRQQTSFWGFYSIGLDPTRRHTLTALALGYVGRCRYGVSITGYKNPVALSFRCDGLVEHCHESLPLGLPLPPHKWGLFEDDQWNTITPAALRNCFFEKY